MCYVNENWPQSVRSDGPFLGRWRLVCGRTHDVRAGRPDFEPSTTRPSTSNGHAASYRASSTYQKWVSKFRISGGLCYLQLSFLRSSNCDVSSMEDNGSRSPFPPVCTWTSRTVRFIGQLYPTVPPAPSSSTEKHIQPAPVSYSKRPPTGETAPAIPQ